MRQLTKAQKDRIEELLSQMTLEEKIGQMNQESPSIVGGFTVPFSELIEMLTDGRLSKEEFGKIMSESTQDYHEDDIRAGRVGSLMVQDPAKVNELQKIAVEESRLGIPLIFGLDVIHGFKTVFPIAIAEAGTFDPDLMKKTARMAARESKAAGVSWHFAPMLDIARDARWGRVSEGPGEDPCLASAFATAKVTGLQEGESPDDPYVAACLKHYIGYGACESGRDYNTVNMAMHVFYNHYLKPFKAAVDAGAQTVMAAFNDLNGIPCTVNKFLLRDILKKQ
ncbi:MAG: glycosyl hydrolase, partial [Firmicutes bacterium]|nr:glycosyl hydrolase [Bacillota bacterium]